MRSKLVLLTLLTWGGMLLSAKGNGVPLANRGLLDLRKHTFGQPIALDGKWSFYWKKLIEPEKDNVEPDLFVEFPSLWNGLEVNGKKLESYGFASYKLKILLPKRTQPLTIEMPEVYCAYDLFLNGKLVANNGKVGVTPETFEMNWHHNAIALPAGIDTATLVLHIANFIHNKGGITKSIVIGDQRNLELARNRVQAIDLVLTGCLLMGGFFFLGLYLLGNRDKAILLFALYSIVYSYRIFGVDNYVLHTLFPHLNPQITVRLEYLTLFWGIGLFGLYTRFLYPADISRFVLTTICGICGLFGLATLVFPIYYFTQLISPFLAVTVFCIIYTLYVYVVAYRRNRPGSTYALLSAMSLMTVFAISLLQFLGYIPQLKLTSFFGYITFFFFQSLILSHRVSFQLKKSREQAEQGLLAKSEFLSTMSHEIRTPLNSVIGMGHLLLQNNPRPDQAEQLDIMLFSANNLLTIVNDILDYNKIEAGKIALDFTEMDIIAIVKNIIAGLQNYAQEKGVELRLRADKPIEGRLIGDPTRIFQVITNLVHNAIKFTNQGFVEVVIIPIAQTLDQVTLNIQVRDSGIGISQEKQAIIFDRFTQADSSTSRSFGGTGLGLAISKRTLELLGSELKVKSEEGKGATFYFDLKLGKTEQTEGALVINQPVSTKEKSFEDVNILLVEDNALNVMVAKKFLEKWGAKVTVAINGQDAIEKLDSNQHVLILMDLHMPVMDGYQASQKIRQMGVHVPIIALTANTKGDIEDRVAEVGMNDIIVKPFLPDELFQKVKVYTKV